MRRITLVLAITLTPVFAASPPSLNLELPSTIDLSKSPLSVKDGEVSPEPRPPPGVAGPEESTAYASAFQSMHADQVRVPIGPISPAQAACTAAGSIHMTPQA